MAGLGAIIYLGCCLTPLLIAAGPIGSGTLLVDFGRREPIGFALLSIGIAGPDLDRVPHPEKRCSPGGCGAADCGLGAPRPVKSVRCG